jgi:hypothetical protein
MVGTKYYGESERTVDDPYEDLRQVSMGYQRRVASTGEILPDTTGSMGMVVAASNTAMAMEHWIKNRSVDSVGGLVPGVRASPQSRRLNENRVYHGPMNGEDVKRGDVVGHQQQRGRK